MFLAINQRRYSASDSYQCGWPLYVISLLAGVLYGCHLKLVDEIPWFMRAQAKLRVLGALPGNIPETWHRIVGTKTGGSEL